MIDQLIQTQLMETLAYVGPGVGAGVIGVILGLIVTVFVGFVAIIWYPFKRMLRRMKQTPTEPTAVESSHA